MATPSATAAAAVVIPKAVTVKIANGGKSRSNPPSIPPIVSPTPATNSGHDIAQKNGKPAVAAVAIGKSSFTALKKKPKKLASAVNSRTKKKEKSSSSSTVQVQVGDHSRSTTSTTSKTNKKQPLSESSSDSTNPSRHPPLVSRYCGCCGDILSTKAYGFEDGKDRRLAFHPHDGIGTIDRTLLQKAAESIQNNLKGKSKSSKSTKASRKKKKLQARNAALYMEVGPHQQEYVRELLPWPEESLEMDMTILEGLMSLKTAPLQEVGCRCWRNDASSSKTPITVGTKSVSPSTKIKKQKLAKSIATGKIKSVPKKKSSSIAKGATSVTSSGGVTTEVVSTKTVIVKCPKTGKKIKKTVRVVKKLVKKKRPLSKSIPGIAGASPTKLPANAVAGAATPNAALSIGSNNNNNNNNKTKIPSFSALGGKDASPQTPCKLLQHPKTKKRSLEEDIDEGSCSDDGSDNDNDGNLKKRRRNDEKADLDLRERLMNCPLENGPLFPSQQELMELTTIRKRNALQTFYKRFNELRQFIAIFGDANVPQQFPENHSLGIWVNKMRMERKKWDTGSERTSLTERKIELLESIDFIWAQNHKGEIGWERRFQEIRKFKRKHGHCNVPTKSAENRALGRWVSTQRTMYKNYMKGFVGKSLTREEQERRIFLLLKEGFLFSMIPNGQSPNGAGGEDGEGSSNDEVKMVVASASSASSPLETPSSEQQKSVIGDSSNPSITPTGTTSPLTKQAPVIESSNLTPKVSSSDATEDKKDNIIGDSDKEPKQSKPLMRSEPNRVAVASEDTNGEHESQNVEKDKERLSFSPSPKEGVSNQDDRMAETSSPPPVPPSTSIAQVSVTTTPTTTPSVSTVASPDRSQSGDEPDSENTKMERTIVENETMEEKKESSVGEMPVAPSLESKPATNHPSDAQTNFSLNHDAKAQTLTLKEISSSNGDSTRKASPPAKEKASKAKVNGKSPARKSPTKLVPKSAKKESPKAKANSIAATALPKSPMRSKAESLSLPTKPMLITSDGLKIIIKMKDDEDDTAAQLSPTSRTTTSADGGAHSPSRRSVRARKPSARQLEAEKSPLRESILGR